MIFHVHDVYLNGFACTKSCARTIIIHEGLEWFQNNEMSNEDKCHLIFCGNKYEQIGYKIGNQTVWETKSQRLLGITIDNGRKFDAHIELILKSSALSCLCPYLSFKKNKI